MELCKEASLVDTVALVPCEAFDILGFNTMSNAASSLHCQMEAEDKISTRDQSINPVSSAPLKGHTAHQYIIE